MLFSQDNVGSEVKIKGSMQTISYVVASRKFFRIQGEENGPVINDYSLQDIEEATTLTVSFDEGKTWVVLTNFKATKQDE